MMIRSCYQFMSLKVERDNYCTRPIGMTTVIIKKEKP